MAADGLRTLLELLEVVRPALTRPGFCNALVVFAGWVLTGGTHAVTQALVATDVARRRDWSAFHRFFSRGTWDPDAMGLCIAARIVGLLPADEPIRVAVDDTLAAKKGQHVFGIGSHLDAVRSTKAVRVFCFGHVWVMLCVVVHVPFSRRPWALPCLFRLYRNEKECKAKGHLHRKKTQLAREMLDVFTKWAGTRSVHLAMDSAYCNDTVMRKLPAFVTVFGSMRPDAALTALPEAKPGKRGRPAVRGDRLPTPEAIARDDSKNWQTCKATTYGRDGRVQTIRYKTLLAQWYRACGTRLLRIVIVRTDHGSIPIRVFFCTDPALPVATVLEGYARRWSIEVCFRDLKQLLGFADSSARKKEAVERTAPFVGYIYSLLVIWFIEGAHAATFAVPPERPGYSHKSGLCFADVLRAAQRVLAPLDVLDPERTLADLKGSPPAPCPASTRGVQRAA